MTRQVAVVIRSLAAGGAEKQAVMLARALAPHHRVQLIATRSSPCESMHVEALADAGVSTDFLEGSPLRKLRQCRRLLQDRATERVFAHLPGDTLLAALAAQGSDAVLCYGGIRNSQMPARKWRVLRWLHQHRLAGSISNSHAGREAFCSRGFDAERVHVIPNGIDLPPERPTRKPREFVEIVSVGRLVPQKDHSTALKAIARLRALLGARFRFTLVGSGPEESKLRAALKDSGSGDYTRLVTAPEAARSALADADLLLSASRFEGLSNVTMEAMALGLPIVATDVGDQMRLVQEGVNGYLLEPGDVEGLAQRLAALVQSPVLRERQGAVSFERIGDYSFDRFAERYLRFIEEQT